MTQTKTIEFAAPLSLIGDRPIILLPAEASADLPSRGQVAVTGAANGQEFSRVIEPDGAKGHWLELDDETMSALSLGEGDLVSVTLSPTKAWPEVEVPSDLRAALDDASDLDDHWA